METHTSKFKTRLGLFVAAGLALFMIGIFYIGKQKHMFNPVFTINSTFRNISGLEIGNNVRFSGINVGTVDNIQIVNDTTVKVSIIVDQEVQKFIKTDCFVGIGSEGLIGDKIVNITQGSDKAKSVSEGHYLPSIEPIETDEIIAGLKVTVGNAEIVSSQLAEILYNVNNGNGTLAKLIKDTTIAENIDQTIVNLKKSTKGLDENMEAAKHNVLLRGYFKNKKKEKQKQEQKIKEASEKNAEQDKDK